MDRSIVFWLVTILYILTIEQLKSKLPKDKFYYVLVIKKINIYKTCIVIFSLDSKLRLYRNPACTFVSCDNPSCHFTTCHAMSQYVMTCHCLSCHITLCNITTFHVTTHRVMSHTVCHVTSHCVKLQYKMSCHSTCHHKLSNCHLS